MNSWPICSIQNLVDDGSAEIQTGPFGTQLRASDYVDFGTPVINVRNIGFGTIRHDQALEFLDDRNRDRLSVHILQKGDIVFGRKGAVERHVLIREEQQNWIQGSDCIRLRIDSSKVYSEFISFFLLGQEHQEWMKAQCSHGSTMASLNQAIISRIKFPLPSIKTQERIIETLAQYGDLIHNNLRRVELLEKSASLIFREWFTHSRFPGYERVKLVNGLPDGWRIGLLPEVAEINSRSLGRKDSPDWIDYIDISSVSTGRCNGSTRMLYTDAPGRAKRILSHGDVIWSMVRPNRRSYCLIQNPTVNLIGSTGFAVLTAVSVPYTYLYHSVTTDAFVGFLTNRATGAAYPAVTPKDFEAAELCIPSEPVLQAFHGLVSPMHQQIACLHETNKRLQVARDLLLPRLMSGSLEV